MTREASLPNELADLLRTPSPVDSSVALPTIEGPEDLGRYLEAYVASFRIFSHPRTRAVLHCLRYLHSVEAAGASIGGGSPAAQYHRVRRAQDLLRYLVYEIFSRCEAGGQVGPSSMEDMKLAAGTVDDFARFSLVRDGVESVKKGWAAVSVDQAHRVVAIVPPPDGLRNVVRQHEQIQRTLLEPPEEDVEPPLSRELVEQLRSTVRIDAASRTFTFRMLRDIVATYFGWLDRNWRSQSAPLPREWSVGPYSVGEFRRFYLLLLAWVQIHFGLLTRLASEGRVLENSAVPVPRLGQLVRFMEVHGGLAEATTLEIVRDLTYDPVNVAWTDIQYQPLVPVAEDRFALPVLVISGSSFERNLLALLDKLPWRRATSEDLRRKRERVMIREILGVASPHGMRSHESLRLRDGDGLVGDIDLLLWDAEGTAVLALQLKWHYGPDSVHEVALHSGWYRRGAEKHLRACAALRETLPSLVADAGLDGLSPDAVVLPIMVTKDDEPMFEDMPRGLPAIKLREFRTTIDQSGGLVSEIFVRATAQWERPFEGAYTEQEERIRLGSYSFKLTKHQYRG